MYIKKKKETAPVIVASSDITALNIVIRGMARSRIAPRVL